MSKEFVEFIKESGCGHNTKNWPTPQFSDFRTCSSQLPPSGTWASTLNRRESKDSIKLRHDWEIPHTPCTCVWKFVQCWSRCGLQTWWFYHSASEWASRSWSWDVQYALPQCGSRTCPTRDDGRRFDRRAYQAPDIHLDKHISSFWETQRSAFFDVQVCQPNAEPHPRANIPSTWEWKENICDPPRENSE